MSLETIPPGSRLLIDANILIYARRGMSEQCRGLLERCAQREASGVVPPWTWGSSATAA